MGEELANPGLNGKWSLKWRTGGDSSYTRKESITFEFASR